jgi:hypothetical protein
MVNARLLMENPESSSATFLLGRRMNPPNGRRFPHKFAEPAIEMGQGLESDFIRHLGDPPMRIQQQLLGPFNALT